LLGNYSESTVEPLPFHGMSTYPYNTNESYCSDPIRKAYTEEWNTRYIGQTKLPAQ
jgi:hypothetical protein